MTKKRQVKMLFFHGPKNGLVITQDEPAVKYEPPEHWDFLGQKDPTTYSLKKRKGPTIVRHRYHRHDRKGDTWYYYFSKTTTEAR